MTPQGGDGMRHVLFPVLVAAAATFGACSGPRAETPAVPMGARSSQDAAGTAGDAEHKPTFLREYTLPLGAYPGSIVSGPDGALWFTTYPYAGSHPPINLGVGRITTTGRYRFYKFDRGTYDIAANAYGQIWWTNAYQQPYTVGNITTAGAITQYAALGGGTPESLTTDGNGEPWYTSFGGSPDVFELDLNGNVKHQFSTHTKEAKNVKWGIGLDHHLWFNEIDTPDSFVGHVIKGVLYEQAIRGSSYAPGAMAVGADGRMWMCDGGSMAAITTSLQINRYRIPAGHGCDALTAASDGNLWTTDPAGGSVLRVGTNGAIVAFPVPGKEMMPAGITVGPDGNLWYTEIQRNTDVAKIGVVQP